MGVMIDELKKMVLVARCSLLGKKDGRQGIREEGETKRLREGEGWRG